MPSRPFPAFAGRERHLPEIARQQGYPARYPAARFLAPGKPLRGKGIAEIAGLTDGVPLGPSVPPCSPIQPETFYAIRVAAQSPLEKKYAQLGPYLNERQRRLVAAADAQLLGRGGISEVSLASGLSRTTIHRGLRELQGDPIPHERVRETGGGHPR